MLGSNKSYLKFANDFLRSRFKRLRRTAIDRYVEICIFEGKREALINHVPLQTAKNVIREVHCWYFKPFWAIDYSSTNSSLLFKRDSLSIRKKFVETQFVCVTPTNYPKIDQKWNCVSVQLSLWKEVIYLCISTAQKPLTPNMTLPKIGIFENFSQKTNYNCIYVHN